MFGLFLLTCVSGAQNIPFSHECLPVDAVVRAKDDL